ncbi:S24 family peptidase [Lactobacillus laiwuensis]|uniref:S24 family peptidase n=1 Tax=Lactobacillus laiwuensis TaxID=2841034 RepID=UPI001CC371F4|nr:S24 family peptidase [Lactobacillus laiwuensis]
MKAVLIDDEATNKRVKLAGNKVILIPENNDYDSIFLKRGKPEIILRKVVHVEYDIQ